MSREFKPTEQNRKWWRWYKQVYNNSLRVKCIDRQHRIIAIFYDKQAIITKLKDIIIDNNLRWIAHKIANIKIK